MEGRVQKALIFLSVWGFVPFNSLLINFNATPAHAQAPNSKGYLPRLADLMNEAMQVHHTKLWFAGHANNWPLADYEVKKIKETILEIKEAIVEIQTASSQWQNVPVGEMLTGLDSSLDNLDQAVKAKSLVNFDTAYQKLTAACNACHARAGQAQVKIIEPQPNGSVIFPDQDFTTGRTSQ
jgi:hypothetical protein